MIPKSMRNVVVLAVEMDFDAIATYPGGPGAAATGNGYSRMTFTVACLAEFIRGLGYQAIPCGNCTGLSIPMAIDAGLGELGRLGLLITPRYGPRVRLAKVITDMPLLPDRPTQPIDISNSPGINRWPINHPRCHLVWSQTGLDCANCIRVCPFNKPEGWLHDATRGLADPPSGPETESAESIPILEDIPVHVRGRQGRDPVGGQPCHGDQC